MQEHELAFAGRPVTVLGLGFLGFNLVTRLHDLGAQVTVLTRRRHQAVMAQLPPGIRVLEGDIRREEDVRLAIEGVTAVFNVCGVSGAALSNADPASDLSVNCAGVLTVLESVRRWQPKAHVVFAGSRLQFGRPATLPVAEDHPQRPTSFYGIHKVAAEAYHTAYSQLHGVPTTVLRLSNPYGFGLTGLQTGYNVLNNFVLLALNGREIEVFAPGSQMRDYVHVRDVVEAFLRAASDERAAGQSFNIGSGVATRLIDAASTIVDVVGRGKVTLAPWPERYLAAETGDFVFDVSKARRELGWQPHVSFLQGIQMTVERAKSEMTL